MSTLLKVSFTLLMLIPTFSFGKTLLVISSGMGMYGDNAELNIAVEKVGTALIEEGLKGEYRKIYKFESYIQGKGERANKDLIPLLKTIVSEREGDEKLDVFSMQHGPDGLPFDGLTINDVKAIIPFGFINNVYSTSCSEFGKFISTNNEDIQIIEKNPQFSQNLSELGVNSYLYHGNDNATGVFTLPLMINNMRTFKDWNQAAQKTYQEFDSITSTLIPAFSSLFANPTLQKIIPSIFFSADYNWERLFNSRIVVGASQDQGLNESMFQERVNDNFSENMISMDNNLIDVMKEYCPTGLSPEMSCELINKSTPLNRILASILGQVQVLFDKYDSSERSCLPGAVINPLLLPYSIKGAIKEVCLERKNDSKFKLSWTLNKAAIMSFSTEAKGGSQMLQKIKFSRKGSFIFKFNNKRKFSKFTVNGIKIFLNGFDGSGRFKQLSRFKVKGAKIYDDGAASGRVRFLVFPIVSGVEEQNLEEITMPDYVKAFGIKVWENNEEDEVEAEEKEDDED